MIVFDYTHTKLKSNRINFSEASQYDYCNDILNVINLIWAALNGDSFVYKQKPVFYDYTHIGIPILNEENDYEDIVDIINKIGDLILNRVTDKLPTPIIDNSLIGVKMVDNMLNTPSKDYQGAINDILQFFDNPPSPFPDGTTLTKAEDFYTHIGIDVGSTIYIKDVATGKYIMNSTIEPGIVSFQVVGTETKAAILPGTHNTSYMNFQMLNIGTGVVAPGFFKALAANSKMGTGTTWGLIVKVVSQANRTFAIENNQGSAYWGVYGYKLDMLDATANPKELKAEATPEFVDGGIIKTAEQFYKFIGLSTGSKFKVKDVFTNTYIRNNSDSAIVKFQSTNETIGEIIAENLNSGIIFKITNGAASLVSPFYLRPDIGTTNGNMFSGVGIELEIQIISAVNKSFVFKSYVNGYYIGTYGRHGNTSLNGSNTIQKELTAEGV